MGNLGMPELIFIFALALLIFGPKKLPELGKQLGKGLGEFKRASTDLKRSIEEEVEKATRDEAEKAVPRPDSVATPQAVPAGETVASHAAEERGDAVRPA
ncbi:MAG TPA: twin-arginine translocase TatA/TatE family subunit [Thermoanaerobaculia bacterium]|nr:twin-arginine translocase TatA/TatE family subunit [Thermoanaerobaculia bacterium]